MSFLLLIFFFLLLSYFLSKWKWANHIGIKTNILIVLFALNALAGFALVYLYGTYYDKSSSDIYLYFNDAILLKQFLLKDPALFWGLLTGETFFDVEGLSKLDQLQYWFSSEVDFLIHEKQTVILLNVLFSFFSLDNIYIHSLFMAFIGFIGQMAIFKFVKNRSEITPILILLIVFLLPTVMLWTSTILKEPLIFFSMGMLLYSIDLWLKNRNFVPVIFFLFALGFGLIIKPYVIISLVLPLIFFVGFSIKTNLTFKKQSLIVFASILGLICLFWLLSFEHFDVFEKLSQKQDQFVQLIQKVEEEKNVGSKIEYNKLGPTLPSLILNMPKAFMTTMFSPSFYELKSLLYIPDIFQNLLILVLAFALPAKYKIPSRDQYPFLWLSVLFVVILFTLVGLVTPILGAIVRYKVPALIFLFFFLFSFTKESHLSKKMMFLVLKKNRKG